MREDNNGPAPTIEAPSSSWSEPPTPSTSSTHLPAGIRSRSQPYIKKLSFARKVWLFYLAIIGIIIVDLVALNGSLGVGPRFFDFPILMGTSEDAYVYPCPGEPATNASDPERFDPRGKALPVHHSPNCELSQLARSSASRHPCQPGLVYAGDTVLRDADPPTLESRIPRVVHVTSKSRCVTEREAKNIENWRMAGHSLYVHDEDAVERFLYERQWQVFPEVKELLECISSDVGKVNMWRYLMLWEYGGIFGDLSASPKKFNGTTIDPGDDAFVVVGADGFPNNLLFAASPRHPWMYFAAKLALRHVATVKPDLGVIGSTDSIKETGPDALKAGLYYFRTASHKKMEIFYGNHTGYNERYVRAVGERGDPGEWVNQTRATSKSRMVEGYHKGSVSCTEHLLNLYLNRTTTKVTGWRG